MPFDVAAAEGAVQQAVQELNRLYSEARAEFDEEWRNIQAQRAELKERWAQLKAAEDGRANADEDGARFEALPTGNSDHWPWHPRDWAGREEDSWSESWSRRRGWNTNEDGWHVDSRGAAQEGSWGESWSHWRSWNAGEDHVTDDTGVEAAAPPAGPPTDLAAPGPPPGARQRSPSSSTSGSEAAEAQDQTDSQRVDGNAVYCPACILWLNGPTQLQDHRIGKKHRKNVQRARGGASVGDGEAGASNAEDGFEENRLGEGDAEDEAVPSSHYYLPIFTDVYRFFGLSWETSTFKNYHPEDSRRSGSGRIEFSSKSTTFLM